MTIKLHYKSILIPLQQILWTCCIFLSSINNTFFSVLVIIFSNMSYFCVNYTNTFFIHPMSHFSVVLRIIFLMCIENYFSLADNYFSRYREFIFGPTMLCRPCNWRGLVRVFDFLGRPLWKLWSAGVPSKRVPTRNIVRERNERGFHLSYKICQELVVSSLTTVSLLNLEILPSAHV